MRITKKRMSNEKSHMRLASGFYLSYFPFLSFSNLSCAQIMSIVLVITMANTYMYQGSKYLHRRVAYTIIVMYVKGGRTVNVDVFVKVIHPPKVSLVGSQWSQIAYKSTRCSK